MIVESPKSPIVRGVVRFMGYGDRFLNTYKVPEVLDHTVNLPADSQIHLTQEQENVHVHCDTPAGSIPLNALTPNGTRFVMHVDNISGYAADPAERILYIPANKYDLENEPVASILHEGGHLWSLYDEAFARQEKIARNVLKHRLELRIHSLPLIPKKRAHHLEAWTIIGESERRASAISIYIIGKLREIGLDPVPHLTDSAMIQSLFNQWLSGYEEYSPAKDLLFSQNEVDSFLAGDLPYLVVKDTIDSHLQTVLPYLETYNTD